MIFNFSVFDWKYPFRANLDQETKFDSLAEIWCLDKFEYEEFKGGVHFFCFRLEIPFLGKFSPTNRNF